MFKDSEDKKERGEFAIKSDVRETPIYETTLEDINDLLDSGHEEKPSPTGDTDQ